MLLNAILYLGFAFIAPVALVAAPLGVLLLFHRPGRREALVALVLLALVAAGFAGSTDSFGQLEASWVCLFTGSLAVALLRWPAAEGRLIATGLGTLGIATASAALLMLIAGVSLEQVHWEAGRHYGGQARLILSLLTQQLAVTPDASQLASAAETAAMGVVELISRLLPGLVLLQSLAALAAAWGLYRMVARHPEGVPLPRLTEFRFSDHLIWGVVAALLVLVLPGVLPHVPRTLVDVGGNLAAFFGGLYMVRGLGVVTALAAAAGLSGAFAAVLSLFVVFFLLPLAAAAALALGVTDTWVDWRRWAARRSETR